MYLINKRAGKMKNQTTRFAQSDLDLHGHKRNLYCIFVINELSFLLLSSIINGTNHCSQSLY